MIVNSVDLAWSMKNINEVTIKGFPTSVNLFGNDPIPESDSAAETLEERAANRHVFQKPIFPHVYIGRDTRTSSRALVDVVKVGLEVLKVPYTDFGIVSLPQMYYLVANSSSGATPDSYINTMVEPYLEFMNSITKRDKAYMQRVTVDCANGVGAILMEQIVPLVKDHLVIDLINTAVGEDELLNDGCGAEFV